MTNAAVSSTIPKTDASSSKVSKATREQLEYLARELLERALPILDTPEQGPALSQYWVAIAGGPGSGKSTCAREIALILQEIQKDPDFCLVVPMDGFHYNRKDLMEKHGLEGMRRRGSPFTFDTFTMVQQLRQAKYDHDTIAISFPDYSRELSDPVPNAIQLDKTKHRVILVEGLYLLHTRDPTWAPLDELWDERWFVEVPSRSEQIERVIQRAVKTWNPSKQLLWGEGRVGAEKRTLYNDVPNMEIIAYCRELSDVVIQT